MVDKETWSGTKRTVPVKEKSNYNKIATPNTAKRAIAQRLIPFDSNGLEVVFIPRLAGVTPVLEDVTGPEECGVTRIELVITVEYTGPVPGVTTLVIKVRVGVAAAGVRVDAGPQGPGVAVAVAQPPKKQPIPCVTAFQSSTIPAVNWPHSAVTSETTTPGKLSMS